jgi:NMD protein affecting ribosome stability and mRNA decay
MAHPLDTPLDKWPRGWLVLECSSILRDPLFITMTESEKQIKHYPVSEEEMRTLISVKNPEVKKSL